MPTHTASRCASPVNDTPRDSERYPLGTPLDALMRARKAFRREVQETPGPSRRGTLAADVSAYLATLPKGRTRDDAETLLDHWKDAGFFDRSPDAITSAEIAAHVKTFLVMTRDGKTRFAPKTVKELRRLLGSVYIHTQGKGGSNPVRDTPPVVVK